MCAPVGMLHGRRMIVVMVVIVVRGEMDVRWRQHRRKHHGCDKQWCGGGAAEPKSDHVANLISRGIGSAGGVA